MRARLAIALVLAACLALAGHVGATQVRVDSLRPGAAATDSAWRIEAMSPLGVGYDFLLEQALADEILFEPAPIADPRSPGFWSTFSTLPPGTNGAELVDGALG
jgi:hypothetical protein